MVFFGQIGRPDFISRATHIRNVRRVVTTTSVQSDLAKAASTPPPPRITFVIASTFTLMASSGFDLTRNLYKIVSSSGGPGPHHAQNKSVPPNGNLISPAIFAPLVRVCNTQIQRPRYVRHV